MKRLVDCMEVGVSIERAKELISACKLNLSSETIHLDKANGILPRINGKVNFRLKKPAFL